MLTTPVALQESAPVAITIPVRQIIPWAVLTGVVALFLLFIVGYEQGALSLVRGAAVHEWVHDARHLLGFPCH